MGSDGERWNFFVEGVQLVFKSWTALRLAVDNEWGGHESARKGEEMVEDIVYWFSCCKGDPDLFALQDQLFAALVEDFNTEVEDGSLTEVATKLIRLYEECRLGKIALLESLRANAATIDSRVHDSKAAQVDEDSSESDASSDENGEDDVREPKSEPARRGPPQVDSDGFTTVSYKRR